MTITRRIAKKIANIHYDSLPLDVVSKAKLCLLDYLGVAVAGANSLVESVDLSLKQVISEGGNAQAVIVGTPYKTACSAAAFVNSITSEVLELGDGDNRIIGHPAQSVIPAVMGVCEYKHFSGKALIEGIVGGYEAMLVIGDEVMPMAFDRGISASASLGSFGAAAGVTKAFGSNEKKIINSLALAASVSGFRQSWSISGTMDKDLMVGECTRRGVIAGLLAESGMTGAPDIIGGHLGFAKTFVDQYQPSDFNENGNTYRITDVYFKLYPSCRHTHATIEAGIALYEKYHVAPGDIDKIIIYTNSHASQISIPKPTTYIAARFSQQYAVSVALLTGTALVQQFTNEYTVRPIVQDMINKVEVIVDDVLDRQWPEKWSSRVEIHTKNNNIYSEYIEEPKGGTLRPILPKEIVDKARGLMEPYLDSDKTEQVFQMVMNLEEIEDVNQIAEMVIAG